MLAFGQLTVPERGVIRSQDHVKNFTCHEISLELLKLQTTNFVYGLATRPTSPQMTNSSLSVRGQSHVVHSRILHPLNMSGTAKPTVVEMLCACRLMMMLKFPIYRALKN